MSVRHLLVIGAQRCGTTWLQKALAGHPEIAMARPSAPEPKVFLTDERSALGREWYERTYFAHATDERIRGEKSTSYLEDVRCADRAVAVLGDPLVIVQLRDPVKRAVSHWGFSSDNGFESRPLDVALKANLEGPLGWDGTRASVSPHAYLERGRYVEYMRPWLERFGDEMRVLFFEEMVGEIDRIGEVYHWLGVSADFRPVGLGAQVNSVRTVTPPLSDELGERLRAYYDDSNRALEELLGRSLPWSSALGPVEAHRARPSTIKDPL